mgnify:CR=1 FL=1
MQNDFIDGSLGSDDAKRIVPNVVKLIQNWGNDKDNVIWYTYDTHYEHDTLAQQKLLKEMNKDAKLYFIRSRRLR